MDARLMFLVKLVIAIIIVALLWGWVLPWFHLPMGLIGKSFFMTMMVWGLWTLRKIANK
jgi:hypothetical protein